MKLVEQHIIKNTNSQYKKIDNLCFLSKNLYNAAVYEIKQHFLKTGKWLRYNKLDKKFKEEKNDNYFALPTNTSQQILMLVDKNLKSYFNLLKKYKNDKTSLRGCPKFPKYKDKIKGRNIIIFTENQARLHIDKSIIKFPKNTNLNPLTTKIKDKLNQVRIIPCSSCYIIEVIYTKPEIVYSEQNNKYLSIDLGINNLTTCFDSTNKSSFIINGKPLKSINQYYNKKKTKLQSQLKKNHNKYSSKRIESLTLKRNNKIKNYLHESSRFVVNYCEKNDIQNIVIGYNKEWKQCLNLGKINNQNFTQVPFYKLISMLQYKAKLIGINVILNEESYTSKCSILDNELIEKQDNYLGKRVKRGLFISNKGIKINADLNGAMNILKKATSDKVLDESLIQTLSSRGQVVWPVKINLYKNK